MAGKTNRPIARLYPLEVRSADTLMRPPMTTVNPQPSDKVPEEETQPSTPLTRNTALRAREKFREWSEILRGCRELT